MVFNWLDKQANKLWDKIDPPVKTTLKPEYRDEAKAGSRRGPNGTKLTRRERAQHLDNDCLRHKLDNSQRKMSENLGGATRAVGEAALTTKALHLHLAPGAVMRAGANSVKTVQQVPRYNDYEKEYIAREFAHQRPTGSNRRDMLNGALGRHRTAKAIDGPANVADGVKKLYDANHDNAAPVYSAPHYTYPDGQGNYIVDWSS